jgi:DNA-directed RNA polymerase specialized sigma24 family protein
MSVEEFLDQIEKTETMIANKQERRESWKLKAENRTTQMGNERVQSTGAKEKMASATVEMVELDQEIDMLRETLKDIERVIEKTTAKSYRILYMVYFKHMDLREVAQEEGKSYTWATETHRKAKKELQQILDGGVSDNG